MRKNTIKKPDLVKILALIAFILVFVWLVFFEKDNSVEIGVDNQIDVTPTQIESIKEIGEWEFLSISNEELVDTIRKGILSDDHLVRIYYGTLRLRPAKSRSARQGLHRRGPHEILLREWQMAGKGQGGHVQESLPSDAETLSDACQPENGTGKCRGTIPKDDALDGLQKRTDII